MKNTAFGKIIKNVWKHRDIRLILFSVRTTTQHAIKMNKTKVKMKKAIWVLVLFYKTKGIKTTFTPLSVGFPLITQK